MPPKRKRNGNGNGNPQNQNPPETETHLKPSAASSSDSASPSAASSSASTAGGNIPDELLFDILTRLPAKSLVRFKLVCSEWRTLTSLQNFISAHLSRAPSLVLIHATLRKPDADDNQLDPDGPDPGGHSIFTYRPPNPGSDPSANFLNDFPGSGVVPFNYDLELYGSTPNGIFCISQDPFGENLTLWNPTTRFSRSITAPKLKGDRQPRFFSIGLAYDPSQDDIKIVRIIFAKKFRDPDEVEFYSLKSGVWTIMNLDTIARFSVRSTKCGVIFEGVPYWRCDIYDPKISAYVPRLLSFLPNQSVLDMEHFDIVDINECRVRMGEIQGCLAVVSWNLLPVLDVWLRYKTDGWKKLYRVDPFPMMGRVLAIYGERGIVLEDNDGDGNLHMFKDKVLVEATVDTHDLFLSGTYSVFSYKESLAPILEPGFQ